MATDEFIVKELTAELTALKQATPPKDADYLAWATSKATAMLAKFLLDESMGAPSGDSRARIQRLTESMVAIQTAFNHIEHHWFTIEHTPTEPPKPAKPLK